MLESVGELLRTAWYSVRGTSVRQLCLDLNTYLASAEGTEDGVQVEGAFVVFGGCVNRIPAETRDRLLQGNETRLLGEFLFDNRDRN